MNIYRIVHSAAPERERECVRATEKGGGEEEEIGGESEKVRGGDREWGR